MFLECLLGSSKGKLETLEPLKSKEKGRNPQHFRFLFLCTGGPFFTFDECIIDKKMKNLVIEEVFLPYEAEV